MDLGKITPAFREGEEVREWRVPIAAFLMPSGKELKVISVYEEEGCMCIDVEEVVES